MSGERIETAGEYVPTTDEVRDSWVDDMFPTLTAEAFDRWFDTEWTKAFDKGWAHAATQVRRVLAKRWGNPDIANDMAVQALTRLFGESDD
ncbi:hypothetical protein Xcel_0557 [Xylanimonas cellulosilytica DSM 15894]|uniref:Uncharacterized protein n=1 Tax=Xylanimonas cellulosilytica (strain DSM 15894 / JCM 12276 / CECT 5975 / KCTC 9989 / LMG 20990 / NBRC 107835 / XIL07) TaxID=446471 RepID=D1BWL4_XYLCX|nr:hypothetical protein [Xylanimonas cellulosilytica]ACZ29596.1 hypothetical protein Xcel_0557 [Xylanimonas cellulosilytica DSM 15894]